MQTTIEPVLCWHCESHLIALEEESFCPECDSIKLCEECEDVIIPAYDNVCDSCYKKAYAHGCGCGSGQCDGSYSHPSYE